MQGVLKTISGAVTLVMMCVGASTVCNAREMHTEADHAMISASLSKMSASLRSGLASWYGGVWQGRKTASGEVYDKNLMTACHRTLPFGTLVRVINLRNHRSVVVKINDRGNLSPQRVIDLSSAAAQKIGLLRAGLAPVKLEIVAAPAAQHS